MPLPTGGHIARSNITGASRISRTGALALIACAWTATASPAAAQTFFGASDNGFTAFTDNGAPLANPDIAVSPGHIVAVVSGELAWFDKNNQLLGSMPLGGEDGLWESVGGSDLIDQPSILWDNIGARFYVAAVERTPGGSDILYTAYSRTADPSDGWFTWNKNLSNLGDDIGFPSVGSSATGLYTTFQIRSSDMCWVMWISRDDLLQGSNASMQWRWITTGNRLAAAASDGSSGASMILLSSAVGNIRNLMLRGIGSPETHSMTLDRWVDVPRQRTPPPADQLNAPGSISFDNTQFSSSVIRNGSLWAANNVTTPDIERDRSIVRWYEIDLNGWPGSGQAPSLKQTGDIDLGPGVHAFLPDIAVDSDGNAAIVFSVSSADQNIAIARAVRFADDPLGEFRQHHIIQVSDSVEPSGQWGAYVGIEADPVTPGVFWSHAPYRTDGWRTWVGKITLADDDIPPSDGPRLDTPDDGFINNVIPVLQWSFNDLASGFRIHVSGNSEFQGDNAYTSDVIIGNSHQIPDGVLECNTRYYWRVVAETPGGDMMSDPESRWFERRLLEDINLDGIVDSSDLGLLISVYNTTAPAADFNGDGIVNSADLGLLLNSFGDVCN